MRINIFRKPLDKIQVTKTNTTLKPIEPISKIEPLRPVNRDTVTFSDEGILLSKKEQAVKRIGQTLEVCKNLIEKYQLISDSEYKIHGTGFENISLVKEYKARLETFLRMLESRTSKDGLIDLLDNIESYFYRLDTYLPFIIDEINRKYYATVVEEGYRFNGDNIVKWREEAMSLFPNVDLSLYNDYQLKEYVVANKNGMSVDMIISIMNPKRAPEHIRLMLLLPDKEMIEVMEHPEYSVDKVKSLFPNLLSEIKNKKGLK